MQEVDFVLEEAAYNSATVLHPLGLTALVICGFLVLTLPRRNAIIPVFAMACFVSIAQRVGIVSLDFTLLRLLIVAMTIRVFYRGEMFGVRWMPVDLVVVIWCGIGTVTYPILMGTTSDIIYKLGASFDILGLYFMGRILIREWDDVYRACDALAFIAIPVACIFTVEQMTGRNLFAVFGGVREITWIREGKLRCQGAFPHPVIAGCFFAAVFPLVAVRWFSPRIIPKLAGIVASGACVALVLMTASSTPAGALFGGVAAGGMFVVRNYMRVIRWLTVFALFSLHMMMEAPVWHLISRIDLVGGSTGYHRFRLIDACIHRFTEWAVLGTRTTAHWGWHLADVTNQYVLEGVRGGIVGLGLFLVIVGLCFRSVGRAWRNTWPDREKTFLCWAVGAALFAHCTAFWAVSYFGQVSVIWYFTLALAVNLEVLTAPEPVPAAAPEVAATPNATNNPNSAKNPDAANRPAAVASAHPEPTANHPPLAIEGHLHDRELP